MNCKLCRYLFAKVVYSWFSVLFRVVTKREAVLLRVVTKKRTLRPLTLSDFSFLSILLSLLTEWLCTGL